MAFVKLSGMPSPPTQRIVNIPSLTGGLNIHDIPWQLQNNQSPDMKNMWWEDGALRSRPAQITLRKNEPSTEVGEAAYNTVVYPRLYKGWYVYCRAGRLYYTDENLDNSASIAGLGLNAGANGTFVMLNDVLYYKAEGTFLAIKESDVYFEEVDKYELEATEIEPYVPTILMNANPAAAGAGDLYQPTNRLTAKKKVLYSCLSTTKKIYLPEKPKIRIVWDDMLDAEVYYLDGKFEVLNTRGEWVEYTGDAWEVSYETATDKWYLHYIVASGNFSEFSHFGSSASASNGNNVRITYTADDDGGLKDKLMACNIATVYGGGEAMCLVLAGCPDQPNAYFWSGNTDVEMDPGYFPVEHYNLAGDFSDPITTFGLQQNMLVIFQKTRVGAATFGTTSIDGRDFITMNYRTINAFIGCDAPQTVQLVGNNLVFANRRQGVLLLRDTTSSDENTLAHISINIEKPYEQAGLLHDLSSARRAITSVDDGQRYWLCANGHAWLWDYQLGYSIGNPSSFSWYYFDNIVDPEAWFGQEEYTRRCFIGWDGYIRKFSDNNRDVYHDNDEWLELGEDYEKRVSMPALDFGTYEVLKNVDKAIFVLHNSGHAVVNIEYQSDYETRRDRTPINMRTWSLVPRDLTKRSLRVLPFAMTAVRRPRCLHTRHFSVTLTNEDRAGKMTFVSAQIYYTLQGADR